jgi:IS30 family transposase
MKINMNSELKLFIISELESDNIYISPKIIAGKWNHSNKIHISHTSMYAWLETGDGNKYKKYLAHSYKGYRKNK